MTNLVGRPNSARGARRRDQLVDAGVTLLAEQGWSAITTRNVAEHAGANVGLIHYYFGGLSELRTAIAVRAGEVILEPVLEQVLGADDERAALEALHEVVLGTAADVRIARLAAELLAEALRDSALREHFVEQLGQARELIVARLGESRPEWSAERKTGAAVLVTALLDGLILHRILDSELPAGEAIAALRDLLGISSNDER